MWKKLAAPRDSVTINNSTDRQLPSKVKLATERILRSVVLLTVGFLDQPNIANENMGYSTIDTIDLAILYVLIQYNPLSKASLRPAYTIVRWQGTEP